MSSNFIIVKGARENNLKNIDVKIPKNSLVLFTGVSGSGKSSLAFNTIYAEGRRRYIDSLSSYARQFLGSTKKPIVDSIEGLSPSISIEQKTTHNNPRSTVGTVTEIYDHLRLLYSRVGKAYCPKHKVEIKSQKKNDILDDIYRNKIGSKLILSSPIIISSKGTHKDVFTKLAREGFLRVKVDKEMRSLDDEIKLDKNKFHNIEIIVDRVTLSKEVRSRIAEAVELALEYGKGFLNVEVLGHSIKPYSIYHSCPKGDFSMPLIEPRLFSFNSPSGMCKDCKGLGVKLHVDKNKLFLEKQKSIRQGGIVYFKNLVDSENLDWQEFKFLIDHYGISMDTPIKDINKDDIKIILYGSNEKISYELVSKSGNKKIKNDFIEGIAYKIERRHLYSTSEMVRK